MCGICGVIGESVDSVVSFELLTRLFENTEQRGEDAAGYWGTQKGIDGSIIYHKEPGKSTDFVKRKIWRKIAKFNPNLMLLHCRAASPGGGLPSINKNNHPFVNSDATVGLIHNGKVPDPEYKALAQRYELRSKCDSEILLRIFEDGKRRDEASLKIDFPDWDSSLSVKLAAIRDIWSYMSQGAMAVAIGERLNNGTRRLWFFRNKYRSLWLADLRQTLGQVFFFSTPKIWHDAICDCNTVDQYLDNVKIIEVPSEEIWIMQINEESPILTDNNLLKFKVAASQVAMPWKLNGESFKIINKKSIVNIITKLDKEDNIIDSEPPVVQNWQSTQAHQSLPIPAYNAAAKYANPSELDDPIELDDDDSNLFYDVGDSEAAVGKLEEACKKISQLIDDVETSGSNKLMEGSLSPSNFIELTTQLEQIALDIQGTLQIIG